MCDWLARFVLILCLASPAHAVSTAASRAAASTAASSTGASKMADNSRALRALRRVGIGLSGAGPLGAFGANVELNFTPDIGFLTGFGGGPGYQAYTFQLKRVFGEASLAPYLVGGYARWYSFGESGRPISDTTPGFLQTKFLSAKQKAEGRIDENLLYPGFGLQYLTLSGPYAGSSVFAELLLLTDIGDFVVAPTGTVGYMYYF